MTISENLMLAILSMDAYDQGYGLKLAGVGPQVGPATVLDIPQPVDGTAVGFYAVAYEIGSGVDGIAPGTTVISYRGTDNLSFSWNNVSGGSDILNGFGGGAGLPFGPQADATIVTDSTLKLGLDATQAVGFYAVAYDWNGDPRGIQGALEWLKAGPFKDKEGKILTQDAAGGLRLDRLGGLTVDRKKETE